MVAETQVLKISMESLGIFFNDFMYDCFNVSEKSVYIIYKKV